MKRIRPKTCVKVRKQKTKSKIESLKNSKVSLDPIGVVTALLHDYGRRCDINVDLDIASLNKRSQNNGLYFFTHVLPVLADNLLDYLETGVRDFPTFTRGKNGFPKLLNGFFRLIAQNHRHAPLAVEAIYGVSSAFKKLRGEYSEELLTKQLDKLLETDSALPDIIGDDVLHYARYLITEVFKDFDPFDIVPRPGPGAVVDKLKYNARFKPNYYFPAINEQYPLDEYRYSTYYEGMNSRKHIVSLMEKPQVAFSRLQFVPKKVGVAREICVEFNDMQCMQQGLSRKIVHHIENSSIVKGEVNFAKQDFNAKAAMLSSVSRTLGTLDMSAGSNRISRSLVSYLFKPLIQLHDCLFALCSNYIDVNFKDSSQERVPTLYEKRMFAPMGSALCFPIMSITHWALIRAVNAVHNYNTASRIFVYGDDLIVPTTLVEHLFNIFPKYGMKFNETKSFYKGYFRESCGVHSYNGKDVTPVYFKYIINSLDPVALQSLIACEYQLHAKGLYSAAQYIRSGFFLPFVNSTSQAVGWRRDDAPSSPIDYRYKMRYNVDYQRMEIRLPVFKSFIDFGRCFPPSFRKSLHYVMNQEQLRSLEDSSWVETEAYLRALTTQSDEHENYYTRQIKIGYKWL